MIERPIQVQVIDYTPERVEEQVITDVAGLARFIQSDSITWINLDDIRRTEEVLAVCHVLGVHPLWIEDVLDPDSRCKAEGHDGQLLVIIRMPSPDSLPLDTEQVSLIQGKGWVLTLQEHAGDVWAPLRRRIHTPTARVRGAGADYLLHLVPITDLDFRLKMT